MESPTKQYKSIEASVFAIDAHYGEGKDVKYWRSKMRRLCAKYRQELSELRIQVNTLKQGEKQYVEKLFPYYVRILEDIAKLREKLADLQFVKKFIKSKKNPRRAAERKLAKTHVKNNMLNEEIANAEVAVEKRKELYKLSEQEMETLKVLRDRKLEEKFRNSTSNKVDLILQNKFRMLKQRKEKYTIEIENFQAQRIVMEHKLKQYSKRIKSNQWNKKYVKKSDQVQKLQDEVHRLKNVFKNINIS